MTHRVRTRKVTIKTLVNAFDGPEQETVVWFFSGRPRNWKKERVRRPGQTYIGPSV